MTYNAETSQTDWVLPARLVELLTGVKAVLWDFDGVIADTEPVQREAFLKVLHTFGVRPRDDFFGSMIGRGEEEIWSDLASQHGIEADSADLISLRSEIYLDLARSALRPAYYVLPVMNHAHRAGAENVVISSGSIAHISALLEHFGLAHRFDAIICAGSPPSTNLRTKEERLRYAAGAWPRPLVLVDDNRNPLSLARATGLRTVGVRHSLNDLGVADADFLLDAAPSNRA